jgi:ATP-dependent helicase/nuclease subunit A
MSVSPTLDFMPTKEQRDASNPASSVWVSANAGSGKTHVLVDRVIRLMLSGAPPDSILCITYTKAAASEMAGRLFERLGGWTGTEESKLAATLTGLGEAGQDAKLRARARQLFTKALDTPGGLKIQTIHAFCERLLHLFPVEAGLSPGFRVMDERAAKELQARATRDVLRIAERQEGGDLHKAFTALTARLGQSEFEYLIARFVREILLLGELGKTTSPADYAATLRHALGIPQHDAVDSVTARLISIDRSAYQRHAQALQPFGSYRSRDHAALLAEIANAASVEDLLVAFYLTADQKKTRADFMSKKAIAALPETEVYLDQEKQRVLGCFSLLNTLLIIDASASAFALAQAVLQRMEAEKHRLGLYGFDDLIARTAALLTSGPARDWVRFKLDPGINHILLDEAQDTSPAQWQIVQALAEEFSSGEEKPALRTLFVVGDPKQSIYSFQGADAASFALTRERLKAQGRAVPVELTTSYRSTQDVLDAVDKVFTPEKLGSMAINVEGERGHAANRINAPGRVELWPLFEDEDEDEDDNAWQAPVDRSPQSAPRRRLARKIAGTIKSWLEPGHPRRLISSNLPLKPDDILILFQSRGPLFRMVLAELRKAQVPVAGADRLDLLQSLIVQDLLMLLHWLLLPGDDHALAIILKSPLVPEPLDDEALMPLCHDRGSATLFSRLRGANAEWLKDLLCHGQTPCALLSPILTKFRMAIAARLGTEALEASDEMLNMAMDYEREHGISLFGFVQWFAATETTLKREMEKAQGEVRLMTVHGAKGLEAPIVFLADAATFPSGGNSMPKIIKSPALAHGLQLPLWMVGGLGAISDNLSAWPDHVKQAQQQERDRLLYVAMTRAADELYVAGVKPQKKDPPEGCWWNTLTAALGEPQGDVPLRLPQGPDAPHVAVAKPEKLEDAPLPDWIAPAPLEKSVAALRAASASGHETAGAYDAKVAKRGRAIHRLMEELAKARPSARKAVARKWALRLALPEAETLALAQALDAPELTPFFGPDSVGEVDIAGQLTSGEPKTGRMDRLAIRPEGLWLLDYKTDRSGHDSVLPTHPYAQQMATYAALLRQAYPGRPVTAALFWTGPKRLEILSESLLTAALQESELAVP